MLFLKLYHRQLLILGIVVWGCYYLVRPYREYRETRGALLEVQAQTFEWHRRNEQLRREIHRLRTDPRAIERVAREKFGWCRPRETVYDFSPPDGIQ